MTTSRMRNVPSVRMKTNCDLVPNWNKVIFNWLGVRAIYTYQDLKTMQSWPLERKIRVTQLRIMEWYEHFQGNVFVSFSGGVDSTVLLDLARRAYPDIKAVFVNTTMEFPEIVQFVKRFENVDILHPKLNYSQVIQKYGYPVISKEVSNYIHWMKTYKECMEAYKNGVHLKSAEWLRTNFSAIPFSFMKCMFGFSRQRAEEFLRTGQMPKSKYCIPKQWQYLIDAPFKISDSCCYHLKKAPIRKYLREAGRTGIVGTLAEESILRRQKWLEQGCNAFHAAEPKSAPLSFWTAQDILQYLKLTKTPYCSLYGDIMEVQDGKLAFSGYQRTGCAGCLYGCHLEKEPNRVQRLKITHPSIYRYLFNKLDYAAVCDYIGIPY